ncbi:hypothetical protein J6590_076087 [Homalodisca vitripennis]|nr:hypothetical protein J6590_076087 [Homalodisca vitripennis]
MVSRAKSSVRRDTAQSQPYNMGSRQSVPYAGTNRHVPGPEIKKLQVTLTVAETDEWRRDRG